VHFGYGRILECGAPSKLERFSRPDFCMTLADPGSNYKAGLVSNNFLKPM